MKCVFIEINVSTIHSICSAEKALGTAYSVTQWSEKWSELRWDELVGVTGGVRRQPSLGHCRVKSGTGRLRNGNCDDESREASPSLSDNVNNSASSRDSCSAAHQHIFSNRAHSDQFCAVLEAECAVQNDSV